MEQCTKTDILCFSQRFYPFFFFTISFQDNCASLHWKWWLYYVLPCRKWNCMPQWILSSFHPLMREIVCRQMKLNCKLYWLQQQVPFVQTQREPLNCQKDLTLPNMLASDNILVPAPQIILSPTIHNLIFNITGKMSEKFWINCKWNTHAFWLLGWNGTA